MLLGATQLLFSYAPMTESAAISAAGRHGSVMQKQTCSACLTHPDGRHQIGTVIYCRKCKFMCKRQLAWSQPDSPVTCLEALVSGYIAVDIQQLG